MNKENAIEKFNKFFNTFKLDNDSDEKSSHTCCGEPFGKYNIPDNKLDEFYLLYSNAINSGYTSHITEVRKKYSPIVIDLDFRQELDKPERFYTEQNIEKFVSLFNKELDKYVDIPEDKYEVFVFEKKEPNKKKDKICDGIHIIYPYVCVKPELVYIIRDAIIRKLSGSKKYFKNIPHTNNFDDIFDKGVISSGNWLLYGGRKPGSHNYVLTKIYTRDLSEIDIAEYKQNDLPKILSVRKFGKKDIIPLNPDVDINIFEKYKKKECKEVFTKLQSDSVSNLIKTASADDVETARNLTKLLNSNRASNFYDWIRVGWCLHNIDYNLLDEWIEFSKRTEHKGQFKEGDCEKRWITFKNDGYSIGTLYHWAKEDNLDGFLEYKKEKIGFIINQSINGTTYDIAVTLHFMYGDIYRCASLKHKLWYEFKNHKWTAIDEGFTLHQRISTEIVNEYSKLGSSLYGQVAQTDGAEKETLLKRIGMLHKVIDKLKSTSFKKDIMTECRFLFYDSTFLDKLDENRDLLCFTNGIYDLENHKFRSGVPDDYISLCTNNEYREYDEKNQHIVDVLKYFKQVLPQPHIRKYVLLLLSSYIQGHTPDEQFHLWTGSGANGKSKTLELFQLALGDYACILPVSLLIGKRSAAGAATPELAVTKGKRFCAFQEPEETDKINVGLMKEFTGGDKITTRQLFHEAVTFKPQFKLLLACNKLPHIPSGDGGTWRRLRVTEWGSKFVDSPKAANEFKKDPYLSLKFNDWKIALLSILISYFKEYKQNGLTEPPEVTRFTNRYQESSNVYLEFINDNVIETKKQSDYIKCTALYHVFRSWFKDSYSDRRAPSGKEFKDYLKEKYEGMKNDYIYGISYKNEDDPILKNLENSLD
jgi:P4 family phage/plasmid primase-like protien